MLPSPSLLLDQSFPNLSGIVWDYPPVTPSDTVDNCGGEVAAADLVSAAGQGLRISIHGAAGWSGNEWKIATAVDPSIVGVDATVDVFFNADGRGLRITLADPAGAAGNEYSLVPAIGANAVAVDSTAETITLTVLATAANTAAAVKAVVDADSDLSSEYIGGEDGTTTLAGLTAAVLAPAGQRQLSGGITAYSGSIDVDVDAEEKIVTVTFDPTGADASLLSAVKTAVDAEDELDSAYYGGEDGTTRLTDVTALELIGEIEETTKAFKGGDNGRCIGILSDADGDISALLAGSDNVVRAIPVRGGEIRPGRFLRIMDTGTDSGLNLVAVTT